MRKASAGKGLRCWAWHIIMNLTAWLSSQYLPLLVGVQQSFLTMSTVSLILSAAPKGMYSMARGSADLTREVFIGLAAFCLLAGLIAAWLFGAAVRRIFPSGPGLTQDHRCGIGR